MHKKRFHLKLTRHRIVILGVLGVIIVFALLLLVASKLGWITPRANEEDRIINIATVAYCNEGDDMSLCNPGTQLYPELATSNTVTTTIQRGSPLTGVCIDLELRNRSAGKHNHPAVALRITNQSDRVLFEQAVASEQNGRIGLQLDTKTLTGQPFTVFLKPKGYLARKIEVANLTDGCLAFAGDRAVTAGDFNDDNQITLSDLIVAIRAYNGLGNESTEAVYSGKRPTLADLVGLIRSYNLSPKGEE